MDVVGRRESPIECVLVAQESTQSFCTSTCSFLALPFLVMFILALFFLFSST